MDRILPRPFYASRRRKVGKGHTVFVCSPGAGKTALLLLLYKQLLEGKW